MPRPYRRPSSMGRDDIVVIERGDQDPVGRAGRRDDLEDPLDQPRRMVGERLDLDVHQPVLLPGEDQGLFQGGDAAPTRSGSARHRPDRADRGPEVAGRAGTAVVVDEPGAGVEGPDLLEVEVRDAEAVAAARVAREPRRRRRWSCSSDSSWMTTGTPSRVNWTSSSQAWAPASRPRRAASRVFSGAWDESPRWAMMSGCVRVA